MFGDDPHQVADDNDTGYGLVEDLAAHTATIGWNDAQRLRLIHRLY
jgi:hypothetical protein